MKNPTIQTDVLVCGGGCAGIGAALAAARNNAKTLLVERAGFSGGIITTVGLPYFDGICARQTGRFVARGIPLELLVLMGMAKPDARSLDDCKPELVSKGGATVRIPNVEQFKPLADHLVTQHGQMLRPLYHSLACDVETRDGRIAAVIVANKDGLTRIEARQVIDCTGDGDIAAWAGLPRREDRRRPCR